MLARVLLSITGFAPQQVRQRRSLGPNPGLESQLLIESVSHAELAKSGKGHKFDVETVKLQVGHNSQKVDTI